MQRESERRLSAGARASVNERALSARTGARSVPRRARGWFVIAVVLCLAVFSGSIRAASTGEQINSAAGQAKEKMESTGKAALDKVEQLWQTIDEKSLRNRTPHEIVGWVIMGLLVGGLLSQAVGLNRWAALVFGLVGAFLGGIVVHLFQIDLGIGPVLIRYEDLLFALGGAVLLLILARVFMKRKKAKA